MVQPLVVICAVGLSLEHLGSDTPCLSKLASAGAAQAIEPVVPAVTTSAQTTMLTGVLPQEHGIVANGWHFRDQAEVWLWRQSEGLVQAPHVWEHMRRQGGQPLRVLKHFWWYAMNSSADAFVTPRPVYHHDGRKSPDIYAWPASLKQAITNTHGAFPLFHFWGPMADIRSSKWIAESYATAAAASEADLSLVYLPHLDYDLQRFGPSGAHLQENLRDLDACVQTICDAAHARGARVAVVSEYGIESVSDAVFINRALREAKLLSVSTNSAGELVDIGMSRAFAVCDHQLAHISVRESSDIDQVAQLVLALPGVQAVYVGTQRQQIGLDHPRSGDVVALTDRGRWFAYDYWLDDRNKPDFAHAVEIHKKPGYDPRELFFDPNGGKFRAFKALMRKKLGFRYLLNPVPLDATLVKGSHGLLPSSPQQGPLVISPDADALQAVGHQTDIAGLITRLLTA